MPDILQQFKAAHAALLKERERLIGRLQEIDNALRQIGALPSGSRNLPPRAANTMNIQEAVAKATARKPLSIREIVDAVQAVGYKFSSSNPVNSVGAYLYGAGKQHFKRVDGKVQSEEVVLRFIRDILNRDKLHLQRCCGGSLHAPASIDCSSLVGRGVSKPDSGEHPLTPKPENSTIVGVTVRIPVADSAGI